VAAGTEKLPGSEDAVQGAISRDAVYRPSDDIVVREIEGELILVPIAAGIGDMEDELYTFNDTGRAIWAKLDGTRTLEAVVQELAQDYEAPPEEIEADVMGLLEELQKRRMVVPV
jgi:hypothetical protein